MSIQVINYKFKTFNLFTYSNGTVVTVLKRIILKRHSKLFTDEIACILGLLQNHLWGLWSGVAERMSVKHNWRDADYF